MDENIYDALVELRDSIERQTKVQTELLAAMRALVEAVENNSQEMADSRDRP